MREDPLTSSERRAALQARSDQRAVGDTRRARITPQQAGLPAYGANRRVKGLRREEVAMLAGVSVDYYTRLERGNLAGASESVLDVLARALQLDEAGHCGLRGKLSRTWRIWGRYTVRRPPWTRSGRLRIRNG